MSDDLRHALTDLMDAARPYLDLAAPHEQLFSAVDLRNFERLSAAMYAAERALTDYDTRPAA
jgi:hypothetical protein